MDRRTFLKAAALTGGAAAAAPYLNPGAAMSAPYPIPAVGSAVVPTVALLGGDEFTVNGVPDPTKWTAVTGRNQTNTNNEYSTDPALTTHNCKVVNNGFLELSVLREDPPDHLPEPKDYTGARLFSQGKMAFKPSDGLNGIRFEVNGRPNQATGMDHAFWAQGDYTNVAGGDPGWPKHGEIDFFEWFGNAGRVHTQLPQTIHSPKVGSPSTDAPLGHTTFTNVAPWNVTDQSLGYHRYGFDWYGDTDPNPRVDFWFDFKYTFSATKANLIAAGGDWTPFNGSVPFYCYLSIFVKNTVQPTDVFPQNVFIDYFRCYSI